MHPHEAVLQVIVPKDLKERLRRVAFERLTTYRALVTAAVIEKLDALAREETSR